MLHPRAVSTRVRHRMLKFVSIQFCGGNISCRLILLIGTKNSPRHSADREVRVGVRMRIEQTRRRNHIVIHKQNDPTARVLDGRVAGSHHAWPVQIEESHPARRLRALASNFVVHLLDDKQFIFWGE